MSSKTMVRDLTKGNVVTTLLIFAMPLFVSNALQALYNLVDMIVVGQVIGGSGMSAVSIGGDTLHILTFLAMGFSSAGQVIIAQYVGAHRMDDVRKTIGTMFSFLLGSSIIISVICYLLRFRILELLNTPEEAFDYTMDYLVVCIAGLIFVYGYNIVSAILRGMGDSKRPFMFVAIAAVVNTVLDIWFVAGLELGVFGAALATIIGQGISFILSLIYLYIKRESFGFDFKISSFAIDKQALKSLISLGIPMAIQSAAVSISKIVITAWVNIFGIAFSAMNGIYSKTGMMVGIVSNSFTTAGSSMVGQNIGAEKFDNVKKVLLTVLWISLIISGGLTIVVLLWNQEIFGMFTSDASVLEGSFILVAPVILNLYGCATRNVAFSLINGSGNSKLNLAVALLDGMISRVGIAALLGFALKLECQGFWFGDAIAGFVPIIIGTVFYLTGKWKSREVLMKHI